MKKYLYSLMVVMFAAFSFALTSCGDDDDEPNDGNGQTLTINGQNYTTQSNCCVTAITDYASRTLIDIELHKSKSELFPVVSMEFETEKESLKEGMTFTLEDVWVEFKEDGNPDYWNSYGTFVSGSISVDAIHGSNITLKFNDLKISNTKDEIIVIKGTIVVEHKVL